MTKAVQCAGETSRIDDSVSTNSGTSRSIALFKEIGHDAVLVIPVLGVRCCVPPVILMHVLLSGLLLALALALAYLRQPPRVGQLKWEQPQPEPVPLPGDDGHRSLASQSTVAVCTCICTR